MSGNVCEAVSELEVVFGLGSAAEFGFGVVGLIFSASELAVLVVLEELGVVPSPLA